MGITRSKFYYTLLWYAHDGWCLGVVWSTWLSYVDKHDDIIKWKHYLHYWPFVWGIHQSHQYIPTIHMTIKNIYSYSACISPSLTWLNYIQQTTPQYNCFWFSLLSGPHLNIKTVLSTYGDFHVKDKTAVLSLTWESPYLVRPSFLLRRPPGRWCIGYWIKNPNLYKFDCGPNQIMINLILLQYQILLNLKLL